MEGQGSLSPKAKAGKGKGKKAGASTPKAALDLHLLEAAVKIEEAKKPVSPKEGEESKAPASKAASKKAKKAAAKAAAGSVGKDEKLEATEFAKDSETAEEPTEDSLEDSSPTALEKAEKEESKKAPESQGRQASDVMSKLVLGAVAGDKQLGVDSGASQPDAVGPPSSGALSALEGMVKTGLGKQKVEKPVVEPEPSGQIGELSPAEEAKDLSLSAEAEEKKEKTPGKAPESSPKVETEPLPVHQGKDSPQSPGSGVTPASERPVEHIAESKGPFIPEETKSSSAAPPSPPIMAEKPEVAALRSQEKSEPAAKSDIERLEAASGLKEPTLPKPVATILSGKVLKAAEEQSSPAKASSPPLLAESVPVEVKKGVSEPLAAILSSLPKAQDKPAVSPDIEPLPKPVATILSGKVLKAAEKQSEEQSSPAKASSPPLLAESVPVEVKKGVSEPLAAILSSLPKAQDKPAVSPAIEPLPKPVATILSEKVLKAAEEQSSSAKASSPPLLAESVPVEVKKGVSEPLAAILSSLPKAQDKPPVSPAKEPLPKPVDSPSEAAPAVPKRPFPSANLKVFLTGGTGSIGRAVLEGLLGSGHYVTCTVKDEAAEHKLESVSADKAHLVPVRLALSATGGAQLTALATGFDAIIHTAQSFAEDGHQIEETALKALIAAGRATAAQGQACHFIASSSLWVLGETGESAVDEAGSTAAPFQFAAWRVPMERLVLEADQPATDFTTALIRPAWVYGSSFVDHYINVSVSKRQVTVPTANKSFGTVHNEDLASLFRLVLKRRATGVFNGCEERAVSVEELTEKMRELGVKEVNRVENPMQHVQELGFFIVGMTVQQRVLPKRALELGWKPKHAFLQAFQQLYGHLTVVEAPSHSPEHVEAKSSANRAVEPSSPGFRHEEQPKRALDTKDEEPKVPTIPLSEKQDLKRTLEDPLAAKPPKEPAKALPKEESKVETVLFSAVAAVLPTASHTKETPLSAPSEEVLHTSAEKEEASTVHMGKRQEEPAKPESQSTLVHPHEPPTLAPASVTTLLLSSIQTSTLGSEEKSFGSSEVKEQDSVEVSKSVEVTEPVEQVVGSKQQKEPDVTHIAVVQEEPAKPESQSTLVHSHEPPTLASASVTTLLLSSIQTSTLVSEEKSLSLPKGEEQDSVEVSELVEVTEPVEQVVSSGQPEEPLPAEAFPVVSQPHTDPLFASSVSGSDLTTEKNSSWLTSVPPAAQVSAHPPAQTQPPQAAPKEETKEKPTSQSQPKPSTLSAEKEPVAEPQKADIVASRSNERPNPVAKRPQAPDHTSNKSCANCSLQ